MTDQQPGHIRGPQTADERTFATPLAEVVETAFVSDGNRAA